jgi:hypothetical protein
MAPPPPVTLGAPPVTVPTAPYGTQPATPPAAYNVQGNFFADHNPSGGPSTGYYYFDDRLPFPYRDINVTSAGKYKLQDGQELTADDLNIHYDFIKKQQAEAKRKMRPKEQLGPRVVGQNTKLKDCCIAPHYLNSTGGCEKCGNGSRKYSHHGMIDFSFRTGSQEAEGHIAPGSPGRAMAYTICLSNDEHKKVHSGLNSQVNNSGKPKGITTFEQVRKFSFDSIDQIDTKEVSADCKALYKMMLMQNDQFGSMPDDMQLRSRPWQFPQNDPYVWKTLNNAWEPGVQW